MFILPLSFLSSKISIFSIVLFLVSFLFIFTEEVSFVFNLVIVLLIHEMGHFMLMKLFGYKNVRMLFIPLMGAFVQGTKEEYSQKQSLAGQRLVSAGYFRFDSGFKQQRSLCWDEYRQLRQRRTQGQSQLHHPR